MEHRISIGVPTYNDYLRMNNLLTSIFLFTPTKYDFKVVALDDGTPNKETVERLQEVCDSFGVPLIKHEKNMGIPTSWNDLTAYYEDCDIQVLFNDDICINDSNWMETLLYFFDNNENIGSVGWNLFQIDPRNSKPKDGYNLPDLDGIPGRVGATAGCSFAFKRDDWKKIKQPDESIGFWSSLRSFYEETDFGFSLWKNGLWSFHIPYPGIEHWGSQTFASNNELSVTNFIDYMPKEEYITILEQCPHKMSLPIEEHKKLADKGMAFRMDYSRVMFAKKWGVSDYWCTPQCDVHNGILKINDIPRRKIKYLDRYMNEREVEA